MERCFEIYGVRVALGGSDPQVVDRLVALLPGGVEECAPETVQRRFVVWKEPVGGWRYDSGGGSGAVGNSASPVVTDVELAIGIVDAQLRLFVGSSAPERVFIHAGAVAYRGRAIVIPGHSFSGKSTLVSALVRAGAVYYSDEYAVLDEEGLVHPYARPLSIREPDSYVSDDRPVETFGGVTADGPVPVGLIAATRYRPDADFSPERRSAGKGILTLLANALPARDRPAQALAAARRAASTAVVLEGERGEAEAAAQALLEIAGSAFPNGAGRHP